jgi:hypothetical protein
VIKRGGSSRMLKKPASFVPPRKHPQRSPEATPPVLASAAALLDRLFEHPTQVPAEERLRRPDT